MTRSKPRRPAGKPATSRKGAAPAPASRKATSPVAVPSTPGVPEAGETPRTVIVTGIAGRLGRVLARRLHREACTVIGIDRRPLDWLPKDMVHHRIDIRSKR